ncbi:MAG: UDP-glucose 4-epimerase GalE [Xanthobacteraceae bacterium]|nr:UDP-glucose 4-epimerase GalE [Xanthobacteraceae bacterium]
MNILVTGGAGFIGSHVCKVLARRQLVPVVYDNLSRGHRSAVKWGPLEVGEIADSRRLREVLDKYQPAAVMHFAAYINVGESVQQPVLYYCNNVAATASLLQTLVDHKPIPFVFSSTAAVYGMPEQVPIPEDHPLRPINPYGWSKLFVERMLADAGRAHKLPWIALRYFNAAGSDPDGEIGEQHDPETHLIPLVIKAALGNTAIQVFGTDYDTSDGTCIRDYIHVMDIADAHVRALDHLLSGGESSALNLANAQGFSVREVISAAERVCGRKIKVQTTPRRPGDPAVLIGAADRAQALLGWKPARSDLSLQIADAWNWFK